MTQTSRRRFTHSHDQRWETILRITVVLLGTAVLATGFWGIFR